MSCKGGSERLLQWIITGETHLIVQGRWLKRAALKPVRCQRRRSIFSSCSKQASTLARIAIYSVLVHTF